jgi:5,10-methenyltetrahydrofolate synthetase
LRERRSAIGDGDRALADGAIARRLARLLARWHPASVSAYWPLPGEPDLLPSMVRWHEAGLAVALPRVEAPGRPLQFHRWRPGDTLASGPFGTREPARDEPLRPELLVMPCLGFDRDCFRLGYGGGYYDRTLEALAGARAVGVAYEACEMRGFAPQPYDRRLDAVVTETRLLRPRRSSREA